MCRVLMSINPQYVEKIIEETKLFEYRRIKCKRDVSEIIIYETSPVCKVVGTVKVKGILEETPERLWEMTKEKSGIEYKFFHQYFEGREKAFAYQLGKVRKFKQPKSLEFYGVKVAPQSYVYIEKKVRV